MKPISMSVKDWLIQHTAEDLKTDEQLCNTVISWTYLKTKEATESHPSIEVSGFGKFLISPTKITNRIKRCEKNIVIYTNKAETETNEELKNRYLKRVEYTYKKVEYLKSRLPDNEAELERNMGRLEK